MGENKWKDHLDGKYEAPKAIEAKTPKVLDVSKNQQRGLMYACMKPDGR